MGKDNLFVVGEYIEKFNLLTGQQIPCGHIYQSSGLEVHIKKRHPNELGNLANISSVIAAPDYIGKNPKEPDSVELVKVFSNNVMVCIKLDKNKNHLYVASVFEITQSKLNNRLNSGRLKKI